MDFTFTDADGRAVPHGLLRDGDWVRVKALAEAQVGQPPRDAEMAGDVVQADPKAGAFVDERQGAPDQLECRADSDGRAARADARVSSTER